MLIAPLHFAAENERALNATMAVEKIIFIETSVKDKPHFIAKLKLHQEKEIIGERATTNCKGLVVLQP